MNRRSRVSYPFKKVKKDLVAPIEEKKSPNEADGFSKSVRPVGGKQGGANLSEILHKTQVKLPFV